MSATASLIIKNKIYEGTRLTIVGSQSGNRWLHYSEANGTRYYVNPITTESSSLEAVTFDAYLSFTSSNTTPWAFSLIPMDTGHSVVLNTQMTGNKQDGSKMFVLNSFGAYKHTGSALSVCGSGISYTIMSDFTGATAYFTASGTSSVNLVVVGTSEIIDWDIFIRYTKGYHTLVAGGGGGVVAPPPWYPPPTE